MLSALQGGNRGPSCTQGARRPEKRLSPKQEPRAGPSASGFRLSPTWLPPAVKGREGGQLQRRTGGGGVCALRALGASGRRVEGNPVNAGDGAQCFYSGRVWLTRLLLMVKDSGGASPMSLHTQVAHRGGAIRVALTTVARVC